MMPDALLIKVEVDKSRVLLEYTYQAMDAPLEVKLLAARISCVRFMLKLLSINSPGCFWPEG